MSGRRASSRQAFRTGFSAGKYSGTWQTCRLRLRLSVVRRSWRRNDPAQAITRRLGLARDNVGECENLRQFETPPPLAVVTEAGVKPEPLYYVATICSQSRVISS